MKVFCRKIIINNRALLAEKGPLLLASNHPNSFLDAVILDVLFDQPIYSLARGDVFINKWVIRILTAFKILPVYRLSEGANNLQANYETFDVCKKIFRNNGIVLIFSEGKCINEWHLRRLKKGTARLAISSWEDSIPLKVLPVGINYSSFRRFGKTIHINFGEMILPDSLDPQLSEGSKLQAFNQQLQQSLQQLVLEIPSSDVDAQKRIFNKKSGFLKTAVLILPALLGWLLHQPLYLPLKKFTFKRTNHNDHYDSVLIALLIVTYPFYLLISSFTIFWITGSNYSFAMLLLLPLMARAYVQLRSAV